MPQENGDPRALVRKVLRLEASKGFADTAVTGGIESFVARHAPDAAQEVRGYSAASPDARRIMASLAAAVLDGRASSETPPRQTSRPIIDLGGIGPRRAQLLERLGIRTIDDLLRYLPRRLEDRSRFTPIGRLANGESSAVRGTVTIVAEQRVRRGISIVKATIADDTGYLTAVWFNQPWVAQQLHRGIEIDLFGRVEHRYREWQMASPIWEPRDTGVEVGRVVPIYPATEGMSDRTLRGLIDLAVDTFLADVVDAIPEEVRLAERLPAARVALRAIHRPASADDFEQARRSLAFEELFLLQLGLLLATRDHEGSPHALGSQLANSLLASLPFDLTSAQRRALREIRAELALPKRMMRLLQGDVGSGKTLVAILAALTAVEAGFQVALMAPTEILAEQHAGSLSRLVDGLPVRIGLLTSGAEGRDEVRQGIESGSIHIAIGTHALIQEAVHFHRLGLVIIDEQHRFGVIQRSAIEEKGEKVDLLVMSATPIPRTIALTLYGEFDISVLDEFPIGPKRTATHWVPESSRREVYEVVERFLARGRRGYVILPLVEESEKIDAKAAVQVFQELSARLPDTPLGLLHGRMTAVDKTDVMDRFRSGDVQLLVSTTVVEVGVDVLDADFMVIEHADRFGLSQLHQLRGRIGRSGQEADCFAVADAKTDDAQRRLAAFRDISDGFLLAEEDLRLRGPGDLLGTHQHGFLTQLRAVDLATDVDLMQRAQAAARAVRDRAPSPALRDEIDRRFGDVIRWLRV